MRTGTNVGANWSTRTASFVEQLIELLLAAIEAELQPSGSGFDASRQWFRFSFAGKFADSR